MRLGEADSKYKRVPPLQLQGGRPISTYVPVTVTPPRNIFLRCPLPGISVASDNLRQFYQQGIPQTRMLTPVPI